MSKQIREALNLAVELAVDYGGREGANLTTMPDTLLESARAALASLPRWTKTKPTVAGWYFYWTDIFGGQVGCVELFSADDGRLFYLVASEKNELRFVLDDPVMGLGVNADQWYGPIELPEQG